jgi:CBS-domain-containing membrane protein
VLSAWPEVAVTVNSVLLFWSLIVICTEAIAAELVVAERANSTRAVAAMESVAVLLVVVCESVPLASWANVVAASLLN